MSTHPGNSNLESAYARAGNAERRAFKAEAELEELKNKRELEKSTHKKDLLRFVLIQGLCISFFASILCTILYIIINDGNVVFGWGNAWGAGIGGYLVTYLWKRDDFNPILNQLHRFGFTLYYALLFSLFSWIGSLIF